MGAPPLPEDTLAVCAHLLQGPTGIGGDDRSRGVEFGGGDSGQLQQELQQGQGQEEGTMQRELVRRFFLPDLPDSPDLQAQTSQALIPGMSVLVELGAAVEECLLRDKCIGSTCSKDQSPAVFSSSATVHRAFVQGVTLGPFWSLNSDAGSESRELKEEQNGEEMGEGAGEETEKEEREGKVSEEPGKGARSRGLFLYRTGRATDVVHGRCITITRSADDGTCDKEDDDGLRRAVALLAEGVGRTCVHRVFVERPAGKGKGGVGVFVAATKKAATHDHALCYMAVAPDIGARELITSTGVGRVE